MNAEAEAVTAENVGHAFPVVFIDDEEDFLTALELRLNSEETPWSYHFFTDAREALEQLKAFSGAVVISDWLMPGMNGLHVCREIEKGVREGIYSDTYVILLTGRSPANNVVEALNCGANDFICKPVEPSELMARINAGQRTVSTAQALRARTKDLEKEVEQERQLLDETHEQLVNSEQMASLGNLVAGVTHEINTPLGISLTAASAIASQGRTLAEDFEAGRITKSQLKRFFNKLDETSSILVDNLSRAAELIRSFKVISVDQGAQILRRVDLGPYLQKIVQTVNPELKKNLLSVDINCPESLYIETYPSAFAQIFVNLIMNTIMHGYDEKTEDRILIHVQPKEDSVLCTYSDNGKGIPPENLEAIFQPFFTTKRGEGGSGLGLDIVHRIVTKGLEGSIRCESEPGKGTTFLIELPNHRSDQQALA